MSSLKKAAVELSQVLHSSLDGNKDCMQAIAHIEEIINSIEQKLNRTANPNTGSSESINFAPEAVGNKV